MHLYLVSTCPSYVANVDNTFSKNTSKTVFFILSNHAVALPALLRDPSADLSNITDSSLATTFSGILYKKRRKKLQGMHSPCFVNSRLCEAVFHFIGHFRRIILL